MCLVELRATGVQAVDEGDHGTSDPQLWVKSQSGELLGRTFPVYDTTSPQWPARDNICLEGLATPARVCFEIRDDWPQDTPPLLNQGCRDLPRESGAFSISLDGGAEVTFTATLPPPPSPPIPPPFDLRGRLNPDKCDAMMRDPSHTFRQMWEVRQFLRRRGENAIPCWERRRDWFERAQSPETFFTAVKSGDICDSNWFEGTGIGGVNDRPRFTSQAPALLGFDETIDGFCDAEHHWFANGFYPEDHAGKCANSNNNILALWGNRLTYNMCRNLEWQICAAKGLLPGQGGYGMRFSYPPGNLDVYDGGTGKSLGNCNGWKPGTVNCWNGFATDDIYFLEICLFSFICKNSDELFTLTPHDFYVCDFDEAAFDELQRILVEPPV